jgi:acetyl esterase/lipase
MFRKPTRRTGVVLVSVILVLATLGCSGADGGSSVTTKPSRSLDYLPGRAADVYLPHALSHAAAVVMLVPGGGWHTADRTGLGPLAARLAKAGIVAVNITYRAAADGVRFPSPVEDIVCAAAFARQQAATAVGHEVRLVVLGHSAGGHLAALVALSVNRFRSDCPYPSTAVDGFVGVAGPYDVRAVADVAVALFGVPPDADADAWHDGDLFNWVARAPRGLRVLLLHGDADTLVASDQSRAFAADLTRGGVAVRFHLVNGADHATIFQPSVIGSTVIAWVRGLVRDIS